MDVHVGLPFKQRDEVLELGGGDQPMFHPNLDTRWRPTVDLVCDFNYPLPVGDTSCDGVYSRFLIEHISWRKVRGFILEAHRILRPGGVAVFITANLQAQMKMLLEKERWEDKDIGTVFGDQNYTGSQWDANAHHAGFSPEFAVRLFKEAGFYRVETTPLPECETDMIITAHKSKAVIS